MLPFELPPVLNGTMPPRWDGENFMCGHERTAVLEYGENLSGWTDELTLLHEQATQGELHPMDVASRQEALRQVKAYAPKGKAVILEVGCSSGFLLKDLINTFPDSCIIGADVVRTPLDALAARLPGVPLMRFDVCQCPLPDQCVDVVIMLNVLEHIEDDERALREAYRILKPTGALVIEVPAFPVLYGAYDRQVRHFRRYRRRELHAKLLRAGFKINRKSFLGMLLFPGFVAIKLFDKFRSSDHDAQVVLNHLAGSRHHPLVRWAMEVESAWLSRFSLPFGVRLLAVGIKQTNIG